MRKLLTVTLILALAAAVSAGSLAAKSQDHSFNLAREATINGTTLVPGDYQLRLDGNSQAEIYRDGALVTKANVEVKPLTNKSARNSLLFASDGSIREVRMKAKVVVFVR